jgi:uncharacterized protein (TIGR00725 family)
MRKKVIGIFGKGEGADEQSLRAAFELGKLIAEQGWVILTGGRNAGVMNAAGEGAKSVSGSLTIGILPDDAEFSVSPFVDIPIFTDMGSARNNINALSSDVAVAVGNCGAGTLSEIALAIKAGKPLVLLNTPKEVTTVAQKLSAKKIFTAASPQEAIEIVLQLLNQ